METILEAGRAEKNYWRDLWHYRELLQVLAWRDVAVRYKQTVIGVAWALIRPFLHRPIEALSLRRVQSCGECHGSGIRPVFRYVHLLPARRLPHWPE